MSTQGFLETFFSQNKFIIKGETKMAGVGRFKGWRSEKSIAKMSAEEQKMYREYVEAIQNARRNNMELPEVPAFLVKEKPVTKGKKVTKSVVKTDVDTDTEDTNDTEEVVDSYTKREQLVREIVESHMEYQTNNILNNPEIEPWWEEVNSKSDCCETVIHHLSREGFCIIETNETVWLNKIKKMIEDTPDKVIIINNFSNGDMLRVKVPYSAMKRCKPSTRTVTEEQKKRVAEMARNYWDSKKKDETEDTEIENEVDTEVTTEVNETPETVEKVEAELMTDEEWEGTPMNKFRPIEEGEDDFEYEPAPDSEITEVSASSISVVQSKPTISSMLTIPDTVPLAFTESPVPIFDNPYFKFKVQVIK